MSIGKVGSDNRIENPKALTYSSTPCNEPDNASGFSCLSRPCASSRALWLHKGVHDESIGLFRPC